MDDADLWYSGYRASMDGKPCPSDPIAADGWKQRNIDKRVRAVMPVRPEGYYHAPIGTFD